MVKRGILRAGLLLLAAVLGGGCASIRHQTSVRIERPVATAWAVFADDDRLGDWMHESWEQAGFPWAGSGAARIGRPQEVTFREGEKVMVVTQTITSIKPREEFAWTLGHEWMEMDNLFRFEPHGPQACTVHWITDIKPNGIGKRAMANTFRGAIKARYAQHLAKLKAAVEAE